MKTGKNSHYSPKIGEKLALTVTVTVTVTVWLWNTWLRCFSITNSMLLISDGQRELRAGVYWTFEVPTYSIGFRLSISITHLTFSPAELSMGIPCTTYYLCWVLYRSFINIHSCILIETIGIADVGKANVNEKRCFHYYMCAPSNRKLYR